MPDRPLVVVTELLADEANAWLAERCEVLKANPCDPRFAEVAERVRGLIVRTYTTVDEALLRCLPNVQVVGRGGVGLDNIDVEACRARGVTVVSTPDANTQAVVEFVLCCLCDALRPRATMDRAVSKEEWQRLRDEDLVALWQMSELTLGILGLGRIGRRVAEIARLIGFDVLFHDLRGIPDDERNGAEPVDLETLFRSSDVISVHVDGRAANRHLVNGHLLGLLKSDAILINTSRGFVIDHQALAAWLHANPAALALLDVHDPEPIPADNPLLGLDNACLTPHLASRTLTAMDNMSWVVKDVVAVLEGRTPQHPA
ncbi:MAG: NAD(P)-dependent oxidoreductase [Phycisphaerae bacterium]|nr:NAD(P)-dependent oxidoreductase [Phycisphaerae bacterium]